MPSLRSKSITTKVTHEEYVRIQSLAGEQTISEWTRDVLLRAAKPHEGEQAILAEVVALRTILLNAFYKLARNEQLTAEELQQLIDRADRERFRRAEERLTARATRGQS